MPPRGDCFDARLSPGEAGSSHGETIPQAGQSSSAMSAPMLEGRNE
jgi:hypothetical protein